MHSHLFYLLDTPGFTNFIEQFGYVGIFLWFISFDQFTPIPEEISLLIIGYLSAHGVFNPLIASVISLFGFITVDIIYYILSRKGSSFIKKKTKDSSFLVTKYKEMLKKHTTKGFFILCFIPRMRMFAPILAGSMQLQFKKFLLIDASVLALFTAIYILLGFIFNRSLSAVAAKMKGVQDIIFFSFLGLAAIVFVVMVIRKKKKEKRNL